MPVRRASVGRLVPSVGILTFRVLDRGRYSGDRVRARCHGNLGDPFSRKGQRGSGTGRQCFPLTSGIDVGSTSPHAPIVTQLTYDIAAARPMNHYQGFGG